MNAVTPQQESDQSGAARLNGYAVRLKAEAYPSPSVAATRAPSPDGSASDRLAVALANAVAWGDVDAMRCLLNKGADPWRGTGRLVDLAVHSGRIDEVATLMSAPPAPDDPTGSRSRDRALWIASMCGHIDLLDWLLKRGADPNAHQGRALRTALLDAKTSSRGAVCIKALFAAGARCTLALQGAIPAQVPVMCRVLDTLAAEIPSEQREEMVRCHAPLLPRMTTMMGAERRRLGRGARIENRE